MDKQLAQLEAVLRQQMELHEAWRRLVRDKLAALKRADHRLVADLLARENQQFQAIAELEKRRLTLVAELTQQVDPRAAAPLKLADLAPRLGAPVRERLLGLRAQLRRQIELARQEAEVARRASEALVRHMGGLVQGLGAALTGVAVYSGRGAAPPAATAVSTFEARV